MMEERTKEVTSRPGGTKDRLEGGSWIGWMPPILAVAAVVVMVVAGESRDAVAGESRDEVAAESRRGVEGASAEDAASAASSDGEAAARVAATPPSAPQLVVADLDYEFYRDRVEPIFLRDRGGFGPGASACAACHVPSGTPLKLQPLQTGEDGEAYWTEEQSRRNFVVVSGLVTPGQPERSRLLREPLDQAAGGADFHVGGKFWDSQEDPEWQTLAEWVRTADSDAPSAAPDAAVVPSFEFFRTCVQRIFLDREEEADRMECAACHGSGFRGFAQELPEGRDFWNEEESRENFNIVMRYIEPGFPLRSRFLTHPLDYHDGGDGYHSGGRRWMTRDDPEWQMLAEWVKGRTPACVVEDR